MGVVIEVARFFSVFDVWLLPWLAVASVECRRGHRSNQEIILLIFDDDAVVWLHRWDEQEDDGMGGHPMEMKRGNGNSKPKHIS